jgi:hypothetical protein
MAAMESHMAPFLSCSISLFAHAFLLFKNYHFHLGVIASACHAFLGVHDKGTFRVGMQNALSEDNADGVLPPKRVLCSHIFGVEEMVLHHDSCLSASFSFTWINSYSMLIHGQVNFLVHSLMVKLVLLFLSWHFLVQCHGCRSENIEYLSIRVLATFLVAHCT